MFDQDVGILQIAENAEPPPVSSLRQRTAIISYAAYQIHESGALWIYDQTRAND